MASSASPRLNLEQMVTGENDGAWGTKANAVFSGLEEAIAGATTKTLTGGSYTLTDTAYVANEARDGGLRVQGTLSSNQTIIIPNRSGLKWVSNETSGSYTLTIKTSSGTGLTVTQGAVATIYCDGSDNLFYVAPQVTRLTGAPQSTVAGTTADNVSFTPTGNTTSTNVQAAISELQDDIDTINSGSGLASKQDQDDGLDDIAALDVTKGNLIAANGSNWLALAVGTDGYRLQTDSAEATGLKWASPTVEGLSKTKGNIIVADGSALQVLAVGTNDYTLKCNSGAAYGLSWAAPTTPASNSITNAMLANVATKTVKGRTASGTGDPTDLTMSQLATMLTTNSTALATLTAAIAPFTPADDIRGTIETGSISIPAGWTTYLLFGFGLDGACCILRSVGVWRSSVTRSVESTQVTTDYFDGDGFLVAIKVT